MNDEILIELGVASEETKGLTNPNTYESGLIFNERDPG